MLTFASAPNFEAPADADTDNDYVVVVRATSGTGAREKTADQTITVTVTDVDGEAPGAPDTPTVSAASLSSVTVTWAAPTNAGPPITDYDYRYRVKLPPGSWTEVTDTPIPGLSATITELADGTEYEVQVRATNAEGTGGWSDPPGSGSTDSNAAPVFTTPATFDAAENQLAVGTVAASDGDGDDSVTGYAIQGGADASKFSIVAATGVLTFASAPNFEAPADADTGNDYVVEVRATSGAGEREKTADQTITVTVTDVDGEAPGIPDTPTVSAASLSSVTVTWAAPTNAGPPITDYDYRYRVKLPPGSWTEVTDTPIPGLSTTITGLAENTEYEVQVRATNAEGTGDWSDPPGSGSTDANAAPVFTTPATFDAAENQTAVGTVEASDGDDSVTGYAIQGGADASQFSIVAATGMLTFASAPNFEDPADADTNNDYVVEVRATSGAGEREKTADQTITVTVTDVDEPLMPAAAIGIASASASEGDAITFTVTLAAAVTQEVTVDYATSVAAGDTAAQTDFTGSSGTLTFAVGETEQTFTVSTLEDSIDVSDETFTVTLDNVSPGDAATLPADPTATGTIIDDDAAPALTLEVAPATIAEDGGTATVTVATRTGSTFGSAQVLTLVLGGTATQGEDYTVSATQLTLPAGASSVTATVTAVDDGVFEGDETLLISGQADGAAFGEQQTLTITDNEGARRVTLVLSPDSIAEDGGVTTVTATVSPASAEAFTVTVAATADAPGTEADFTLTGASLSFAANAAESTGEVTIAAVDNDEDTPDKMVTVSGTVSLDSVTAPASVTVTINDDDELPPPVQRGVDNAWLSRFGRAASDQVVQSIGRRLDGGARKSHLTVMGRRVESRFESSHPEREGRARRPDAPGRQPDGRVRAPDGRIDAAGAMAGATRGFGAMPGPGAVRSPFDGAMTQGSAAMQGGSVQSRARAVDGSPANAGGDRAAAAGASGNRWLDLMGGLFMSLGPNGGEALATRDMVKGSSFYYGYSSDAGPLRGMNRLTAWGEGASTRFSGAEGKLSLDGEVNTAIVGADGEWGRWLAGVALSYSEGEGDYREDSAKGGAVSSTLTGVNPYARYRLDERTSFWGTLGYGSGRLTLTPKEAESSLETDMTNVMAAFGGRGVLSMRTGETGQFELALRSDAMLTDTTSTAVTGLAAGEGATNRIRLILEGSGSLPAFGGVLAPKVEAGLRYDGGDAETGAGLEVGGGLAYDMRRLTVEVDGRVLLTHQDRDYEEWGYSLSFVYKPARDGRGLRLKGGSQWGAAQSGVHNLWSLQNAGGLASGARTGNEQRYTAELGYGFGVRRLWYPYIATEGGGASSRSLRLGLKLNAGSVLEAGLEIGRRAHMSGQIENDIRLQLRARW